MRVKKSLLIFIFCLTVGIAAAYFFRTAMLRFAGNFLVVDQKIQDADCIVVLSGGYENRISKAIELLKKNKAKWLILTGPHIQDEHFFKNDLPCNPSWPDLEGAYALRHGINKTLIYNLTTQAASTQEEAESVTRFIKSKNWKSCIVVTSNYHTRRAGFIFKKYAEKAGLNFYIHAAPDPILFPEEWWNCRPCAKNVFYEYTKLIYYIVNY